MLLFSLTGCGAETRVEPKGLSDSNVSLATAMDTAPGSVRIVLSAFHTKVGSPPRSELEHFRAIPDGIILANGSAVLADKYARRLVLMRESADLQLLAPSGEGPGEVRHPSGLIRLGDDQFAVLDNALYRLTVFEVGGRSFSVVRSEPTMRQPRRICALPDRYVGVQYSPQDNGFFQEFPFGAEPKRPFGRAPTMPHLVNQVYARGFILCIEKPPGVVAVLMNGELSAYDLPNQFRWKRRVPGFEPMMIEEQGSSVVTALIPDSALSANLPVALVRLDSMTAALQLMHFSRDDGTTRGVPVARGITTLLVDTRSGTLIGSQDDLPQVLDALDGRILVGGNEPEPWVAITTYTLVRERR